MSDDIQIQRAIAQQLASLTSAGVQHVGIPTQRAPDPATAQPVEPAAEAAPITPKSGSAPEQTTEPSPTFAPESAQPENSTTNKAARAKSLDERKSELQVLAEEVAACEKCDELCANRTQTVFGVGNPKAQLCFLGEAPGADEDRLGEPFVGQAGKLLTKIIEAMGLTRDDVYILNVLKCRPPGNRNPEPDEVANCRAFFEKQLAIIEPEYICCLGAVATQNLLDTHVSISKMRGKFQDWNGYKVLATYHPAYLLRNPSAKKLVWEDMQILMKAMGIAVPKK